MNLIVGGFDKKAQLYHIDNLGRVNNNSPIGLAFAGAGAQLSQFMMAVFNYSKNVKLSPALGAVFIAKKRAENVNGVGRDTDIWIISKDGSKKISHNTTNNLSEKYRELLRSNFFPILDNISVAEEKIEYEKGEWQ